MKHVLITGANGYIGQALARAVAKRLAAKEIQSLTLVDLAFEEQSYHHEPGLRCISGDLSDETVLQAALTPAPDTVFHLASVTSRLAEENFALGLRGRLHPAGAGQRDLPRAGAWPCRCHRVLGAAGRSGDGL